jgi:hypothetical protein
MLSRLSLVVAFRETGWRRPLADPVTVEVFDQESRLVAIIPASHILALIHWQLSAHRLQGEFAAYVEPPPPPPPRLIGSSGRKLRGRKEPDHAPQRIAPPGRDSSA